MSTWLGMATATAAMVAIASSTAALGSPADVPLTAAELAEIRGGFLVPGGMIVTLGVTTATDVNGQEVLRSTLRILDGAPQVGVSVNGAGVSAAAAMSGPGVDTADGTLRLTSGPAGSRVELVGNAIDITHQLGRQIGTMITNTGNDRSIDTSTVVDIGLGGVTREAVGNSMARVENLALASTMLLTR